MSLWGSPSSLLLIDSPVFCPHLLFGLFICCFKDSESNFLFNPSLSLTKGGTACYHPINIQAAFCPADKTGIETQMRSLEYAESEYTGSIKINKLKLLPGKGDVVNFDHSPY